MRPVFTQLFETPLMKLVSARQRNYVCFGLGTHGKRINADTTYVSGLANIVRFGATTSHFFH
jgi:hypothetical protein